MHLQSKLLRVLESGEVRRVGDNEAFTVDVRVVCATHQVLEDMVEAGDFREDLMFRINTFEVRVPPLRDRVQDIPDLAEHLFQRFHSVSQTGEPSFSGEALSLLQRHVWPGNVRELANVIEHASIMCDHPPVLPEHLPQHFNSRKLSSTVLRDDGPMTMREIEMLAIHRALDRHDGSKPAAAAELGMSLKTLYNKMNQANALGKTA